jgi:hypothetical protein
MKKLLRTASMTAAVMILPLAGMLVLPGSPAMAVCNPGSPHCIKVAPGSTLAKLKAKLSSPGTLGSGEITCVNSSLCGIDTGDGTSPGALRAQHR